jgi:hypothetical protein
MQIPMRRVVATIAVAVTLHGATSAASAQDTVSMVPLAAVQKDSACARFRAGVASEPERYTADQIVGGSRLCGVETATLRALAERALRVALLTDNVAKFHEGVILTRAASMDGYWRKLVDIALDATTPRRVRVSAVALFLIEPGVMRRYNCFEIPGALIVEQKPHSTSWVWRHHGAQQRADWASSRQSENRPGPSDVLVAAFRRAMVRIAADSSADARLLAVVRCGDREP